MARRNANKDKQFKRYRLAYGNLTDKECEDLWDFDTNYCDSDEHVREFLETRCSSSMIDQKQIDETFYKSEKDKPAISKAEQRKNSAKLKSAQSDRLDILAKGLEDYTFLFGQLVERTNTELKYVDSETGKGITIKLAKHKVQKVVTKVIKRKPIRLEDGTEAVAPFTTVELRTMAIENVLLSHQEDFQALSFAGTSMGFATGDSKYPFASIKMTHHKS